MVKKYGWKYFFAMIGTFFIGLIWPIGFFFSYIFKDEKDEAKLRLIKGLQTWSWCWFGLELVAIIGKIISGFIDYFII